MDDKNQNIGSQKPHNSDKTYSKKIFIELGVCVFLAFFISQLTFDYYAMRNFSFVGTGTTTITELLEHAINNVNKLAPVDPTTGRVYFPDASLVLPPSNVGQIEYTDFLSAPPQTPQINVTTSILVSGAESKLWTAPTTVIGNNFWDPGASTAKQFNAVFKQVPNLQACTRGVSIYYSPQRPDNSLQLKANVKLMDSKTLYLYTNTGCSSDLTGLVNYLKQIQSY